LHFRLGSYVDGCMSVRSIAQYILYCLTCCERQEYVVCCIVGPIITQCIL
jgi:hypothetical protein